MPNPPTVINLSNTTPAAPSGYSNVKFQGDSNNPRNVSAALPSAGGMSVKTGNYTILITDCGMLIIYNSNTAGTFTLPAVSPFANWTVAIQNIGIGKLTVNPGGSTTLDGQTTGVILAQNNGLDIYTDGTNYNTMRGVPAPTPVAFVQATSSGYTTSTAIAESLSGVAAGDAIIFHVRSAISTAPTITSALGNTYVLIHTVSNGFWTTYTYTYLCIQSLAGNETITATFGSSSPLVAAALEYSDVGGYDVIGDNGISANAVGGSTLSVTSVLANDTAVFFLTTGAGFLPINTNTPWILRTNSGAAINVYENTLGIGGSVANLTVTIPSTANQAGITGVLLYPAPTGRVQSVTGTLPIVVTGTTNPNVSVGTAGTANFGVVQIDQHTMNVTAGVISVPIGGIGYFTSNYNTVLSDMGRLLVANAATTVQINLPSTLASPNWYIYVGNINAGNCVIQAPAGVSLDGVVAGSLIVGTNQGVYVGYDGTNFVTMRGLSVGGGGGVTAVTATSPLASSGGTAPNLTLNPTVGFIMTSGVTGTNMGPMLAARMAGSITKCVVVTKASDGTVSLSFRINKNGVNIFSSNPSIAAGTGSGVVSSFSLSSPSLSVAANDVFSIDVLTGNSNWQFTAQVE